MTFFDVNAQCVFCSLIVCALLCYIFALEVQKSTFVFLEPEQSLHTADIVQNFPLGPSESSIFIDSDQIVEDVSNNNDPGLSEIAPTLAKRPFQQAPIVIGWCPSWGEEYAYFLAPYLFPDGNYVFQKMSKQGLPRVGQKQADILICTGWNYAPELKDIHKQILESGKTLPVPEEYSNKWNDHIWFGKKDPIVPHNRSRPYILSRNAEAWGSGGIPYDSILDCKRERLHNGAPSIYMPWAAQSFCKRVMFTPEHLILPKSFDVDAVFSRKKRFMAFITRDCIKSAHAILVSMRVAFFDYVSKNYKQVDALGQCRHNVDPPFQIDNQQLSFIQGPVTYYDETVMWYAPYKFVITFENNKVEGYITEKIINAILANAIPIFFGGDDIFDYVNPKRIIVCLHGISRKEIEKKFKEKYGNTSTKGKKTADIIDFAREAFGKDFQPCLDRIKELDQNDHLYKQVIREPFLPNNSLEGSVFDIRAAMLRFGKVLRLQNSWLADRVVQP